MNAVHKGSPFNLKAWLPRAIRRLGREMLALSPALLAPIETLLFRNIQDSAVAQPVFIIGAPRSGSTILYQAITNYFDTLYIDNLACRLHRNLRFGVWLSRKIFDSKPHDNFESKHGSTMEFGWHAPSECGAFWYRWLPRDDHFVGRENVTSKMVREMRRDLFGLMSRFERPIIIKNLNMGQRLQLIERCFPDARIIHLKRDEESVVKSILEGRKRVRAMPGEWWGVKPKNWRDLLLLPELEMVRGQVRSIEHQIEVDLKRFPAAHKRVMWFEMLDTNSIDEVGKWLNLSLRPGGSLPRFRRDR